MVDLHNHTPLCNHAEGKPQEYINNAIKKNIVVYGFADHAPMEFDKKYRMSFEDMPKYEKLIKNLKKEYEDKIKILVGYEVDFTPKKYLDKRVLEANVDYLIGSVHFLDNWGFDNPEFIKEWKKRDVDDVYKEYFSLIEEMANSKLFQIVGHLDLIKVFGYKPKKNIKDLAKNAIKAIKKADMTIEINTAGLRKPVKELYPSDELLEMILEENINLTLSSDAHSPNQVGFASDETINKLKSLGVSELIFYENKQKERIKLI
ncbi:histidinol-phosphatase [Caminibacter mediatlanticus]|uniref:Histidinol-phosphatase n=1 Tax=Caminibacter mediatlanticus TB-2 TaxID=391592 RepID=A0AAI9F1R9_9BACT|nr:histidinol-phosphatase [Caminibacter mediatlanticus]EDM23000.1 Histidinol phosphate phosphatase, HisJ [Caminibacter mediatlanticus TB-2]